VAKRGKRGSSTEDAINILESTYGKPEPTAEEWSWHYTPEQLVGYTAEVASIEAQLDEHWAPWRERKSFAGEPKEKQAWIKARLKRRDLILTGKGTWGVHIQWHGERPIANPVPPPRRAEAITPAFGVLVSVPMLARDLKISVKDVQDALSVMPVTERDAMSWVRSGHAAAGGDGSASLPASPPPPVATLEEGT
jgi:hypothetical protein